MIKKEWHPENTNSLLVLPQKSITLQHNLKVYTPKLTMASASSKSAKNLFSDSKKRLAERVQVNVNNMGSIARQTQRGSRSHELLTQTAKHFCQTENTMENSFDNLQRAQVLLAQLNHSNEVVFKALEGAAEAQELIKDMQR